MIATVGQVDLQRKQPSRRTRRKRRSKPAEAKKTAVKDQNLAGMMQVVLQSTLMLQQQMRMVMGVLLEVFLLPGELKLVQALLSESKAFAAEAVKRRTGQIASEAMSDGTAPPPQPLGPPTCTLALAFLENLHLEDIGGSNRASIQALAEKYGQASQSEILDLFQELRLTRTAAGTKFKLQFAITRGEERRQILLAIEAIAGAERKEGSAPAGYLEEEVQEWLDLTLAK